MPIHATGNSMAIRIGWSKEGSSSLKEAVDLIQRQGSG